MESIKYLILSIFLCLLNPFSHAQDAERILETNKPALVSIWTLEEASYNYFSDEYSFDTLKICGSGFFVSKEGQVGTCYHVISQLDTIIVKTSEGIFYAASVVSVDTVNDLAVVKTEGDCDTEFSTVKMGNSDELRTGEPICAIGNPLGYEYSISQGIISGIRDNAKEKFEDKETVFERVIQTDAAVSPGNSGGAFFNSNGEVIGITSYNYLSLGNLNFGVAINCLKKLIESGGEGLYVPKTKSREQIEVKIEYYLEIANDLKHKLRKYSAEADSLIKKRHAGPSQLPSDTASSKINRDSLNNIYQSKAEYFYNKCLKIDSAYFNTYDDMIDYFINIKNPEKAEEVFSNAQKIFPGDTRLEYLSNSIERYYLKYRDFNKIRKLYGIVDDNKDIKPDALYKLGCLYEKSGDSETAIKQFQMTLKKDSKFYRAYFQLGKYYYKLGYYSKAKEYFNTALETRLKRNHLPGENRFDFEGDTYSDFELYFYLGMISARSGNKWEALINYLKLNPSDDEENEMSLKLYNKIVK